MNIRTAVFVAALFLGAGLAGCETATPYQPLRAGAAVSGGFTDQRLEADRFRVSFQGNTLTSRDTVETYLLYRAAELTVAQGFDGFQMVDRHTDRDKHTYIDPGPGPWGYWRPYWRYYGGFGHGGFGGWRGWDPYWGGPFWADDLDIQTVQKFEASAEIVMRHGAKPTGDTRAFDAHEVMANLAAKIKRPT